MAESRIYQFVAGIETAAAPDPGTPSAASDVIPLSYLTANYSAKDRVTNTYASPYQAIAGTSIAHGMLITEDECVMFVKASGGAGTVDMSANPQIAAPTKIGQRLTLVFTSDTERVKLENGTGLQLLEGDRISLAGMVINFVATSLTNWLETNWNDVGDLV